MLTETIPYKKKTASSIDWTLLLITVALLGIGLVSIYSATFHSAMDSFFTKQAFSVGLGFALMIGIMFIPEDWLRASSWLVYGGSIALLGLVLVAGKEINGTKGWLVFAGFSFQPSELAKLGALMLVSNRLSKKGTDIRTIRDLFITAGIILLPVALIVIQPDIGSASVMMALLLGVLFWAGFDSFFLYIVIATPVILLMSFKSQLHTFISVGVFSIISLFFQRKIILTGAVIGLFILVSFSGHLIYERMQGHQKARIETFANPTANPRGTGYNVIQSLMAVGSGGLYGKGFLQGSQTQLRYIPYQWTDFIYSVPTEEFGFIGGTLVLILIACMIWRAANVSFESDSRFLSLMAMGSAFIFLYHTIINIGMVIGVTPVMGIPLPFLSYGGSAIMINLMLIGFMLNSHRKRIKKRYARI